jgi:hypothetical protein
MLGGYCNKITVNQYQSIGPGRKNQEKEAEKRGVNETLMPLKKMKKKPPHHINLERGERNR